MDQRIAKTKKILRTSLFRLIKKKALSEISVSELCNDAGVNRTTFYKYYQIPSDIYNEVVGEIYQEAMSLFVLSKKEGDTLEESLTLFFTALYNQRKVSEVSLIAYNVQLQFEKIKETTLLMGTTSATEDYSTYYIAGGILSIILLWSQNGYKESPEELARISIKNILHRK